MERQLQKYNGEEVGRNGVEVVMEPLEEIVRFIGLWLGKEFKAEWPYEAIKNNRWGIWTNQNDYERKKGVQSPRDLSIMTLKDDGPYLYMNFEGRNNYHDFPVEKWVIDVLKIDVKSSE